MTFGQSWPLRDVDEKALAASPLGAVSPLAPRGEMSATVLRVVPEFVARRGLRDTGPL